MTHYPANPIERQKRNLYIDGKRTSLSLEVYLWQALEQIAFQEGMTIDDICSKINQYADSNINLTAAIRFMTHKTISLREQSSTPQQSADEIDHTRSLSQSLAEDVMPFPSPFFTTLESFQMIKLSSHQENIKKHHQNFDMAQDQKDDQDHRASSTQQDPIESDWAM